MYITRSAGVVAEMNACAAGTEEVQQLLLPLNA
jgi:hypothetical protein